ncbi:MAG TPA: GAF domain-containing protein [Mycobacterium sp.]|nr:GAF domain-containing protein [Mycobacterium sp.]HQE13909.1 GAF domain-containing protein [Mycobacterium sp.]
MVGSDGEQMLRAIIDVQHAINKAGDSLEDVMRIVVNEVRRATSSPGAAVEIITGDTVVVPVASGSVKDAEGMRVPLPGTLSSHALNTGEVLVSDDTEVDSRVDRETCRRLRARSLVAVPLRSASGIEGVLKVASDQPGAFDRHDIELLERLAGFIATALSRATTLMGRRRATTLTSDKHLLQTIIDVQQAINSAVNTPEGVMRTVVDKAREATDAPGAAVQFAEGNEMVIKFASGLLEDWEGLRVTTAGTLSGLATLTGSVVICEDTETDSRVDRESSRKVNVRSSIIVPLKHGDRAIGVLQLVSDKPHDFDQRDAQLLEELAGFIAAAWRRATLMDEWEHAATVDGLTGLANRQAFLDGLDRAIAEAAAGDGGAEVLYLDLNRFKPINDIYGHAVGDEVLRAVAHRIAGKFRPPNLAARIGGDEFAVLLAPSADRTALDQRAELLAALREPIPTSAGVLNVDAGCGTAVVNGTDLAESVLARADTAMYADKRITHGSPAGGDGAGSPSPVD